MDCGMPGFPVPHQPPEFAQVHIPWISDQCIKEQRHHFADEGL